MSDGALGLALLALGAWGSLSTVRDVRRARVDVRAGAGPRPAAGVLAIVGLVASVLATLTGAALLLDHA